MSDIKRRQILKDNHYVCDLTTHNIYGYRQMLVATKENSFLNVSYRQPLLAINTEMNIITTPSLVWFMEKVTAFGQGYGGRLICVF